MKHANTNTNTKTNANTKTVETCPSHPLPFLLLLLTPQPRLCEQMLYFLTKKLCFHCDFFIVFILAGFQKVNKSPCIWYLALCCRHIWCEKLHHLLVRGARLHELTWEIETLIGRERELILISWLNERGRQGVFFCLLRNREIDGDITFCHCTVWVPANRIWKT